MSSMTMSKLVVKFIDNFHQVVHLITRTRAWTLVQRKTELREISKYNWFDDTQQFLQKQDNTQKGGALDKVVAL